LFPYAVVDADIGFAPGAEDNGLAVWIGQLVSDNLADQAACRRDFSALRAAVALVAPDRRLSVTLRFDHGHLTIHDGMVGIPDVTLCGDYEVLVAVAHIPLSPIGRLPLPPLARARTAAWRTTALELVSGELKVYGLLSHPLVLLRVLRLLSTGYSPSVSPTEPPGR
jgi:hypothetical protein